MTGFDVPKALCGDACTEALRVVAVSANAMEADIGMAMAPGAVDYWTKPLKLQSFVAGISTLAGELEEHTSCASNAGAF